MKLCPAACALLITTLSGVTLLYRHWVNTLTVIHMKMAAVTQDASFLLKGMNLILLKCVFSFSAPNRPPGSVSWKAHGSRVTVSWDQVTAMHNESAILGYKVSPGSK